MLRKTLKYGAVLVCGALALAGPSAVADDKKDGKDKPALSGSWVKKEGELKLEFADKDTLKIAPHGNDDVLVIVCGYTLEKGQVKAEVNGFEGKDEAKEKVKEKLPVGSKFSFKWKVDGDTCTLDDVKGDHADLLKGHLEGKYGKKD
jgi:hypothetical protein